MADAEFSRQIEASRQILAWRLARECWREVVQQGVAEDERVEVAARLMVAAQRRGVISCQRCGVLNWVDEACASCIEITDILNDLNTHAVESGECLVYKWDSGWGAIVPDWELSAYCWKRAMVNRWIAGEAGGAAERAGNLIFRSEHLRRQYVWVDRPEEVVESEPERKPKPASDAEPWWLEEAAERFTRRSRQFRGRQPGPPAERSEPRGR